MGSVPLLPVVVYLLMCSVMDWAVAGYGCKFLPLGWLLPEELLVMTLGCHVRIHGERQLVRKLSSQVEFLCFWLLAGCGLCSCSHLHMVAQQCYLFG